MNENVWQDENLTKTLKEGGVAVMPTDTIYGIVGQVMCPDTVERIYQLRKRTSNKVCIVLINNVDEISKFGINLTENQKNIINSATKPTSFIVDSTDEKYGYLDRGTKTLTFRVPSIYALAELLAKTGPLIAPSANTEGMPPARTIQDAQEYFGDGVDIYCDGGEVVGAPSRVVKLHTDGTQSILRE